MAILSTDGSQSDVSAKLLLAVSGDYVDVPPGAFTWGVGGTFIEIPAGVTLRGQGNSTAITLADDGPTYGNSVIRLVGDLSTAASFAVTGNDSNAVTAFSMLARGRILDIDYTGGAAEAYFCYFAAYGLITGNRIEGGAGGTELIFGRGPEDSWETPSSMGTEDALFVENNIFTGSGYVCDANSNARVVVRFNRIEGQMKIDAHGKYSNTPPRGVRHIEAYENDFQAPGTFWQAGEYRGGTGFVFNNRAVGTPNLILNEYYVTAGGLDASDYPIDDQIGVGEDPKSGASEPMVLWGNRKNTTDFWPYVLGYGEAALLEDVIMADRDVFQEVVGFDGTSGVGIGTKAQMEAITPALTGVYFWVTDEGDWNTLLSSASGRLYTWDGADWNLHYQPYQYPHPLAFGNGDHFVFDKTANSSPVTELVYRAPSTGGALALEVIHHSGDYPADAKNGYRYAKHGPLNKAVYVFGGTRSVGAATAKRDSL